MENILINKTYFKKLPLDNAAKIYPAAMTKKWNAVFGLSAKLYDEVSVNHLKKAVCQLAERFPSMYVKLKSGAFWDYFETAQNCDIVYKDKGVICEPINVKNSDKPLFRILYSQYEIRAEFFHSVTDGTGAFEYFKALLLRYYELKDETLAPECSIKRTYQQVKESEIEDSFQNIYKRGAGLSRKDTNAFQIKLKDDKNGLHWNRYFYSADEVKRAAKEKYSCTVTQFIATAYALALLSKYDRKSKKPVKLSIPVNLRPYFNSGTVRNFSSYITVNVTPETEYTFEAVLELIKKAMAEKINKDYFFRAISKNIADEKMLISKFSPNFAKKIVMKRAFRSLGEKKFTSTVTSIGNIKMPPFLEDRIESISVALGKTYINKINCTVVGFKGKICVGISCAADDMSIQNEFEKIMKKQLCTI